MKWSAPPSRSENRIVRPAGHDSARRPSASRASLVTPIISLSRLVRETMIDEARTPPMFPALMVAAAMCTAALEVRPHMLCRTTGRPVSRGADPCRSHVARQRIRLGCPCKTEERGIRLWVSSGSASEFFANLLANSRMTENCLDVIVLHGSLFSDASRSACLEGTCIWNHADASSFLDFSPSFVSRSVLTAHYS